MPNASRITVQKHWMNGQCKNKCSDSISPDTEHIKHLYDSGVWWGFPWLVWHISHQPYESLYLRWRSSFRNHFKARHPGAPVVKEFVRRSHRKFPQGIPLPGPFVLCLRHHKSRVIHDTWQRSLSSAYVDCLWDTLIWGRHYPLCQQSATTTNLFSAPCNQPHAEWVLMQW